MVMLYHSVNMCFDDNEITGTKLRGLELANHLIERSKTALSNVLLCASDRPLGLIGLVADFEIERLFAYDVLSFRTDYGRDVPDYMYDDGIIHGTATDLDQTDQSEVYSWIENKAKVYRGRKQDALTYSEVWGRTKMATAIYVTPELGQEEVSDSIMEFATFLSKEFGLPIVKACKYTSIYKA